MPRRVILVPGILRRPDDWRLVESRISDEGYETIVPEDAGRDWSPQALADALRPLLPAHVIGHSRGGTAASWLAVDAPEKVLSLTVVCSPPQASEAFRAHFERALPDAQDAAARGAFTYLASIPEDDFPTLALRKYRGPALVVESGDDPLYSPTHTMFWRQYLPYASFERTEGGHAFFTKEPGASWLADRLLLHLAEAERG